MDIALLVAENDVGAANAPSKDAEDTAAVDATLVVVTPNCITESAAKVDTFGCAGLCAVLLLLVTSICGGTLFVVSTAVDLFVDSATCLSHTLRSSAIILRV